MEHDVILAAYKSYNEGDLEGLLRVMCEDVNFMNALTGGRIKGHAEMREFWALQQTSLEVQTEPIRIYEEADGKTVVLVREVMREVGGALLLDQEMEHVFTFRDGLVERMDFRHVAQGISAQASDIPSAAKAALG